MDNNFLKDLARLNNYSNLSSIGNIDILQEWIKLFSYQIGKSKKDVYALYKKTGKDLTIDELDILKKYKENKRNINIIKKYKDHKCNEKEYVEVYNLIQKPIVNEILNVLSKDELVEARSKINKYLKINSDDLNKLVLGMKEQILELSIVDLYVLHIILDVNFTHSLGEINRIK